MSEEYLSEEMQEAAEPADENIQEEEVLSEENAQVAEAWDKQDSTRQGNQKNEADAAFAQMRRSLAEERNKNEAIRAQLERVTTTLKDYGFDGQTPDEVADAAIAHRTGKSVEQIRTEREQINAGILRQAQMEQELNEYRAEKIQRIMDDDLKAIQKIDPSVKSLDELGRDYANYIRAGLSGTEAFEILHARKERQQRKAPETIGKLNASKAGAKDFYTSDEVDRLTDKELDDPKIFEAVMRSMTKW